MDDREKFYRKVINKLILDKKALILVCGGGELDRQVLLQLGFENVTISNLDERMQADLYTPFRWEYENAENLSYQDNSFDYVIAHAAIHHASSPHRMLLEMYRVARRAMIGIEARDSLVMRIFQSFSDYQGYEQVAVFYNNCEYGGVNNTEIPNYVYRWTEREVEKTICSYAPYADHHYDYLYGMAYPGTTNLAKQSAIKKIAVLTLLVPFRLLSKLAPTQQNLFAFCVRKPNLSTDLYPWLMLVDNNIKFNKEWGERRFIKDALSTSKSNDSL